LQRRATGARKTQRYEILESLRHFAAERQEATEEGTAGLKKRFSRYYLDFLADHLENLRSERQQEAVNEIAQEIGNVRSAWRLAVEGDELSALTSGQEALAMFYYMRSWFAEGEGSFAMASKRVGHGQPGPERDVLRARLMAWHGWFCTLRGQIGEGLELLQEATALLRSRQAHGALSNVLPYLAVATSSSGDNAAAEALALEAQQIGRQRDDRFIESVSANVLSQIAYLQGNFRRAQTFGQESLALQRESGNYWSMAFSLSNLGRAAFAEADYRQASAHYQEAIEIRQRLGDARGEALGLLYLGDTALAQADLEATRQAYETSLTLFREIGSRSGAAQALCRLGRLATEEFQKPQARRLYAEALELARSGQAIRPMLEALWGLAQLLTREAPEQAMAAARLVALHPAASEGDRQGAKDLVGQMASEAEDDLPELELAPDVLDQTAGQLLRVARTV
jgi:tetratricopeptide (TPR) repeat protein